MVRILSLSPLFEDKEYYLSLHTGDPRNQSQMESVYFDYQRVLVKNWTIIRPKEDDYSESLITNFDDITFPECTDDVVLTVKCIGIGRTKSGPGELFIVFDLLTPITISKHMTPRFTKNSIELRLPFEG